MAGDPNTVTFNVSAPGGGSIGSTPLTVNAGVQGAGVSALPTVGNGASWFGGEATMEMPDLHLPDFLNAVAAPNLEAQKTQQMWDGFVAARGGMSQQDIDKEQPWYTQVFGPTNYQLGAVTYTSMDKTAQAETDIMQRMPELRKLAPQDMAAELNRVNQSMMTGNSYGDAIIQKNFMDRAGPMMDVYHKEAVAWQQQDLMNKSISAITSAGKAYHTTAVAQASLGGKTPLDPKVVDQQQESLRNMLDVLTPSANQTDASVKAITTTAIKTLAQNGDWYTVHALDKLGVMSHLDADDEEKLREYLDKAETRTKHNLEADPQMQEMLARVAFTANAGIGGKPTWDMMKQVNDVFSAKTGIDSGYYSTAQTTDLIGRSTTAHLHAQETADNKQFQYQLAAYKVSMKEDKDAQKRDMSISSGRTAWNSSNLGATLNLPNVDKPLVYEGAYTEFQQQKAQDPARAYTQLVNNAVAGAGAVLPQVSDELKNRALVAANAPAVNDAFLGLYQDWKHMTTAKATYFNGKDGSQSQDNGEGGKAAAVSYFGAELAQKMQSFDTMLQGNASSDMAYGTVFGKNSLNYAAQVNGLDQSRTADLISARADQIHELGKRGTIMGWFHDDNMTDAAADQAARLLSQYMASNGAVGGSESSMQVLAAMKMAQAHGAEFTGRYALDNKGLTPVYQWNGFDSTHGTVTPQAASHIINDAAEAAARKVGLDPNGKNVNLIRMQNGPGGAPVIQIYGMTDEGWKFTQFSAKELKAAEAHQRVVQQQPTVPMGYVRNPDGTVSQSLLQPRL